MRDVEQLFENNRRWAAEMTARDPEFFSRLSQLQAPRYLWIGCSDSRVPANEIVGLLPGEIFVHRNVANVVDRSDANAMSALQYAVQVLRVRHVIVCGHYGCGGVDAAFRNTRLGQPIDMWLRHVRDVHQRHRREIDALPGETDRLRRLCELNVAAQVANVARSTPVQDAWSARHPLVVHGLIYDLSDGLLRDLGISVSRPDEVLGVR
jgi:carbonic anhydrase